MSMQSDLLKAYKLIEILSDDAKWLFGSIKRDINADESRKARLAHSVEGVALITSFAVLEEYLPAEKWEGMEFMDGERERLRAYRHLRHCFAHGFDGARAKKNKKDTEAFDKVMKSPTPITNIDFNSANDSIWFKPGLGIDFPAQLKAWCQIWINTCNK